MRYFLRAWHHMKERPPRKDGPQAEARQTLIEERTSMLEFISRHKWQFAICTLLLMLVQMPCNAQSSSDSVRRESNAADQPIPPAILRELQAMRQRIDDLEAQLKAQKTPAKPAMVNALFPVKEAASTVAD